MKLLLGVVAKLLDITLQHDTRFSLYYVSPRELVNLFCSHGYGSRGSLSSGWKDLYLSSRYLQPGLLVTWINKGTTSGALEVTVN